MLGKGLESLIPPQKGNGQQSQQGQQPASHQPEPAQQQPQQPQLEPERELPAPPVHEELPPAQPLAQPQPIVQPPAQQPQRQNISAPIRTEPKEPERKESVYHIEIEKIKPNPGQPRRYFDEAALKDLASSIREFGFLQPLVVTKMERETPTGVEVDYQLIAGERRFMAAKLLGLARVPAIIRNVDLEREKLELAVIENIQREDLNPIETARAFQRLQEEFRMTQREIAVKLGKSRETVANTMRLLDLPEHIRTAVEKHELSESHARLLLTIQDPAAQQHLFDDILHKGLTVRELRDRVGHEISGAGGSAGMDHGGGARRGRPPKSEGGHLPPELRALQQSLSSDLGAPVEIYKGQAKGSITITFYSEEELRNIMQRLGKEEI